MDVRHFHKRLYDSASEMMPPGSIVVCGVSGGADSMALLHGLVAVGRAHRSRWQCVVAHVNHRLREDSAADAAFVERAAGALGLVCRITSIDVAQAARTAGETVEEAGRRLRYAFMEEVAAAAGARVVAVGHHADDQAETVLHHIVRGTGLRGLAGMPPRRAIRAGSPVELVRPLLGFPRAALLEYLDHRGLPHREDASNTDTEVSMRNRIRHEILPLLEARANPGVRGALLRLAVQARRADEAVGHTAAEALNRARIRHSTGEVELSAAVLAALPRAIRTEAILRVLRDMGIAQRDISFERIEAAADAACGPGRRRRIELPGGASAERQGKVLLIRAAPRHASSNSGHHEPPPAHTETTEEPCL